MFLVEQIDFRLFELLHVKVTTIAKVKYLRKG